MLNYPNRPCLSGAKSQVGQLIYLSPRICAHVTSSPGDQGTATPNRPYGEDSSQTS